MPLVREPLVSVVIINWNYAKYVADAIASVKDQSYQNFECLVIDNASTDDSVNTITAAIDGHPQFMLCRLPKNLGQLGAAFWSLDCLRGEFVTYLDADDVLFPEYLVNHLQAHLSAAYSSGFTSSNCLDVDTERALTTGGNWLAYNAWREGEAGLRSVEHAVRLPAFDEDRYSALANATRYVPWNRRSWLWCPGSSNMFRRALLARIRPKMASEELCASVDGFYLPILHAISGSNLIGLPLSAYRVHGANRFSRLMAVSGVYAGSPEANLRDAAERRFALISLIDGFEDLPISPERFWEILDIVGSTGPARYPFGHPEIRAAFARQYFTLTQYFGEHEVLRQLRRRFTFGDYLKTTIAAGNGLRRIATRIRRMAFLEVCRKVGLALKKIADVNARSRARKA
jgi:glycosyltransferase involved in cell wall biosynthesis